MRGPDTMQERLFTMARLEEFVPGDHPLRPVQRMVNEALKSLNGLFNEMYADHGRASIAPEKLIRALLLQVLYSVRSERLLVEQLHYNLLFRWFVGLAIDDAVWDHSSFSKNRERLLDHAVIEAFFAEVMAQAEKAGLLSDEHFSVDGTLIKAWASHKSFQPKDGPPSDGGPGRNAEGDWRGKARSNDTHESTTDPEARLHRKSNGSEAILCYQGHVLIENANGLVVNTRASLASGFGERENALAMLAELPGTKARTVGADKAYDTADFVAAARQIEVTAHVAQHLTRHGGNSAIDARTTRHAGYRASQCLRKRVEEPFGWAKTVGHIRQTVFRGLDRVNMQFMLTMAANNLVRMRGLLAGAT
jgi:transposase